MDLLTQVKQVLRDRGAYELRFGADWRHFMPGCPLDLPRLKDFLIVEGFDEMGDQHDVACDLADYNPPANVNISDQVRPLTPQDVPDLDEFLLREFPGRWRFDTMVKVAEEGRPDFVYGLWADGALAGFALTQDCSNCAPGCGAVWRASLGENWCCLGPIGIAKERRGKGLGDTLLASALTALKNQGMRRCLIDWTSLLDWYGKHGFKPVNNYLSFSLRLDM